MPRGKPSLLDPETGQAKKVKPGVASYNLQMTDARVKRLKLQNEKLALETEELRGKLVYLDEVKQKVLVANALVKTRLAALPEKLAPLCQHKTPAVIADLIRKAITEAMNELAYERLKDEQAEADENALEQDSSTPEPHVAADPEPEPDDAGPADPDEEAGLLEEWNGEEGLE